MTGGILYIGYDGMLDPVGHSQVLPYLERLALEQPIDLSSFEKRVDWNDRERRGVLRSESHPPAFTGTRDAFTNDRRRQPTATPICWWRAC